MNDMKCPFCQQELVQEGSDNYWCKKCNLERHNPALYGSQKLWQELIHTRKDLEQSEICCAEWEKQALDYKAENIALSGDLECTRKALDVAVGKLKGIKAFYDDSYADPHTFVNWHIVAQQLADDADDAVKDITALKQKDIK